MRQDEFKLWFEAQQYAANTINTLLATVRKIELTYGDLDELFDRDGLAGLAEEFAYSAADRAAGRPNPSKLTLWGDTYRDLGHVRAALNYYRRFREGASRIRTRGAAPDRRAVERAMDECAEVGVLAFMEAYDFSWANLQYYAKRGDVLFPSKAIFAVAHQYMPSGIALDSKACNGTEAHEHLAVLEFEIVKRPPILLFGHDGRTYEPVMQANTATGVTAYRYKPKGASNRTDDAVETKDVVDIARALFEKGLPVRIALSEGSVANYLTYPGQKFSSRWLRPDIAAAIDAPEQIMPTVAEGGEIMNSEPSNIILYGPPGTGKTWRTAYEAVRLCDGSAPEERKALMARYKALEAEKRIAFVTFHQSMDYETFVEGLLPETKETETSNAGFRLEPRPGLFQEFCSLANDARKRTGDSHGPVVDLDGRQFWKMSLGAAGFEDDVYEAAAAGDYIALGWGGDVDWSDPRFESAAEVEREWKSKNRDNDSPSNYTQLWPFRAKMKKGDIVIVPYGNSKFRAVAEVTGDYEFVPGDGGQFNHRRRVKWLRKLADPLPLETIVQGEFAMRTLYPVAEGRINKSALGRLIGGAPASAGAPEQFVLVIDELNRANVTKVFGELITLIEPDKRLGQPNELKVLLPHSGVRFGVPDNLHIIGTMNTADRSIALLDTALRRRFRFIEVAPDPGRLSKEAVNCGEPLVDVLRTLNDRIEYLLDRDHCIGHAYFVGCRTRQELDRTFRDKVIPLLQEYFFEDWSKVATVLGERTDHPGARYEGTFLNCRRLKDPTDQGGPDRLSWSVRETFAPDAYRRLVSGGRVTEIAEVLAVDAA